MHCTCEHLHVITLSELTCAISSFSAVSGTLAD